MEREHRNLFFYEGVIISFDPGEDPDFTKLTIYGKSTQDGTPTPEAPVDIVSVGDDGNLIVTTSDGGTNISTATITTGIPLCGIPVTEGGNVTIDGQQYIADTIEVNADGSGKVVKRVKGKTLNELRFRYGEIAQNGTSACLQVMGEVAYCNGSYAPLCTMFDGCDWAEYISHGNTDGKLNKITVDPNPWVRIGISNGAYSSIGEFLSQYGNVVVYYIAETPTEIPLSAAEVQSILSMQTFSPVTNVYNDDGAWQKLEGILWEADA